LSIIALLPTNPTCYGGNNGVINVLASGMSPLQYSINDTTFGTGFQFSNLTSGTYLVTVKDGNGCTKTSPTVIASPSPIDISASITGVVGLTPGNIKIITINNGTAPYQFSINGGVSWQSDSTFANLNGGAYTITTSDASCSHDTILIVPSGDTLNVITVITNIKCFGDTTGIISMTMGDANYKNHLVFLIQGPDTVPATVANDAFTSPELPGGNYLITVNDAAGAVYQKVVTILEPGKLVINGEVTNASCNFHTVDGSITTAVNGGTLPYSYSWNTGSILSSLTSLNTGHYSLTVTDANTCSATEAFTVNANDSVFASAGKTAQICQGVPYKLMADSGVNYFYSWTPLTGLSNSTIQDPLLTTNTDGRYQVTVSDAQGCVDTASVLITVYPTYNISVGYVTASGFEATHELYVDINKPVKLEVLPDSFASYKWSPSTYLDNPSIQIPTATITETNPVSYVVTTTTNSGCTKEDSITINVRSHCAIPSGFTPYTGTSKPENQVWTIECAVGYPNILVEVYNRWGQLVYMSTGYDNQSKVFTGKRNGSYLPAGTYYYIIDFKDGTPPEKGSVTIVSTGK
jgi:gliding motility-associated-like protein